MEPGERTMKPSFLIALCASLTTCTVALAQTSAFSPWAPTPGTPLAFLDSPPAAPQFPANPAGTSTGECTIGSPGEMATGAPGCLWAEAEYLLWWMKGASLPPLITASPAGTPSTQAGVLGAPTTTVVFGGAHV